ncbi:rho GTPase-activating protein 100F-like isoform X1 [Argiope bruennichi]|uniref:rho GTPase-activating protein 100F-like isoform X1 n=1 Tax=Argiope bruennichi TaxID=94029 RepID=UPI002494F6FB|nr:rho GTPase-activating protein 100F-like isoform X1 [Argiope bruennichi]
MSTSIGHPPRLRYKMKHILSSTMLCCGRKKETREVESQAMCEESTPNRRPTRPLLRGPAARMMPEMVVQSDFRKVSGISTEIFRQIEAVEKDFDPQAAEAVEKRGEMIIRLLDPASLGRVGAEACRRYLRLADASHVVQFVEIIKRPGQTLGLYIREGDLLTQSDGVFISRIALESAVYSSGLLKVEDEILAVNLVDVRHVSLDDVVIIMSIPRRLVLTIRSRISGRMTAAMAARPVMDEVRPPVVVVKKEFVEDVNDDYPGANDWMRGPPGRTQVMLEPHHQAANQRQQPDVAPYYYNMPPPKTQEDTRLMWEEQRGSQAVLTRQPKPQPTFPTTLQSLAEQVGTHPVHTFHAEPTDPRRLFFSGHQQQVHPRSERSLPERYRYLEDPSLRSRSTRLLRTESEQRISTLGSDTYDRFYSLGRPLRRSGSGMSITMQRRGRPRRAADEISQPLQPQAISTLANRRRPTIDGSASDTEATESTKNAMAQRQRGVSRPSFALSRAYGATQAARSNSLPRVRMSEMDFRRFQQITQQQPASATVRLLPYDSQSDSDGALSAPELPATRSGRRDRARRMTSPIFTSAEYSQWLTRAPSTSVLYDRTRRAPNLRPQLPRSAHSAESLLDRLKQEEQRGVGLTTSVSTLYTRRPLLRSATDLASELGRHTISHQPNHQTLFGHPYVLEYLRQIPNPTPVKPSEERLHLLTLNPREFLKYRPEKDSETVLGGDGFSGLLWVHLLAGRGLRSTSHSDHFRDLYCVIECDRVHKARTVVRTGEHSFDWDEVFELELVDNTEVAFLLYSWDPQLRHKLCYKGSVHLLTILRESPSHSLALKMEPRGTLYLKLRYRDPRQTFQRLPSQNPNGVFGVDLESLVIRENSGFSVPLIVKRCAEEVEKRGLDIVGIYRLCGSAVRKKTLRDAFERNSHNVDLSPDHVPDINVITSVLKDYLRELPEPLFTKGLFDMLVDGFSVCLPDDPEGNAKLMFSILDCLPKVNRCTVLYLMDHLRSVTSHSDRNKMSSQSLAICFGPVVMCHTETGAPVAELRKPIEIFKYLLEIWPAKRAVPPGSGSSNSSGSNGVLEERNQAGGGRATPAKKPMNWGGQRPLPESSC